MFAIVSWYTTHETMKSITVTIDPKEQKAKVHLLAAIEKKQQVLSDWMEKVETLRVELDAIHHEYNVRIGSLLLKDNQLDLEILKYKNLKELMNQGMSYTEALKHEEDMFYNEILRMQKEQEKLDEEKEIWDSKEEVSDDIAAQIKDIWKRLIRKFHPDLITDVEEKVNREEIMKKINKAYTENNLVALQELEQDVQVQPKATSTKEELEQTLINIENMIIKEKIVYSELKVSEWFEWKKRIEKAKKESVDVFYDLERKLLDDIVKKIETVQRLRVDFAQYEVA